MHFQPDRQTKAGWIQVFYPAVKSTKNKVTFRSDIFFLYSLCSKIMEKQHYQVFFVWKCHKHKRMLNKTKSTCFVPFDYVSKYINGWNKHHLLELFVWILSYSPICPFPFLRHHTCRQAVVRLNKVRWTGDHKHKIYPMEYSLHEWSIKKS